MEAVVTAGAIESQQMIAEQRQLFPAQDSKNSSGRADDLFVVHT
jgi:hypothetical protein